MHKIVKIVLVVLGVIGAVLWFQLPARNVPVGEAAESGAMNFMFIITYVLLGIALLFSVVFSLINLFSNPASLKRALMTVVGLIVVVGIAYFLADGSDGTVEAMAERGIETSETVVKRIGTGLWVFFILTIIAVGSMLYGGVKNMTR